MFYDYAIIGGGIVGLSTGMALSEKYPSARILVLEKEDGFARHQTGHNSGVIHSGLYYKPGSYKAKFAVEGCTLMHNFCRDHGIAYDNCGKIVVAFNDRELPLLDNLYKRGLANGIPVTMLSPEEIREIEPHCAGLKAIKVPTTGIADYKHVTRTYASLIQQRGGTLKTGARVEAITPINDATVIRTTVGEFQARFVINCAGLHSDRVATMAGADPGLRIVPFRGEYYELRPEKRYLVKHLIYPVPNPDFPFLGVHFTRMTDGNIHCGPNAVWALKREGYTKLDIDLHDMWDAISYRGFRKLVTKHMADGLKEIYRSFSKAAFARSLQRLIPEVREEDLIPSHAGVRAQALLDDGKMVDDFLIVPGPNSMHVCNAPSPAATASIPIGREIASKVPSFYAPRLVPAA